MWAFSSATTEAHDQVSQLQQRFTVLSGSAEGGQVAFAALVKNANQMGVGLDDGAQAFNRFIIAGKEIGVTTAEATDLASTFLKLGRIGGATTAELQSGLVQWGQAMQSGKLQGDEFRAINESMGIVMQYLAKEMKVSAGALKELSSEGKITADVMVNALANAAKDVDNQFASLPRTASAMGQEVKNNFTLLLDDLDSVFGGSNFVKSVYTTLNDLVNGARDKVKASEDVRIGQLQDEIDRRNKSLEDRKKSWFQSPAFDQQDTMYRDQAQKELDDIRKRQTQRAQKEREDDLQAGLQRELNIRQKHQQTVDKISEGADPLEKALKERDKSLSDLKSALDAGAISEERYSKVVGAVNDQYDDAVERANKRANALTIEDRAINRLTANFESLALHITHAEIATQEFADNEAFTRLDMRASDRVVDFLTDFAKQARISGASLQELADLAGISLEKLRADFRKLEVELTKRKALERSRELSFEVDETSKLANATLQGAAAAAEMAQAIEVERQLREMGLDAKDKDLDKIREEVRLKLAAKSAQDEYLRAAQDGMNILRRYGDGNTRLGMDLEELDRTRQILAKNGKLTTEMAQAFDVARYEAVKASDTISGSFLRAAEDIGYALTDSFERAFANGRFEAKDLMADLKRIFAHLVIQVGVTPVKTPLITKQSVEAFGISK